MMHSGSALRELFGKLTAFAVTEWGSNSDDPHPGLDRKVADLKDAQVITSLIKDSTLEEGGEATYADLLFETKVPGGRHHIVIDLDHPAHLVESSTPGHHHLYVEIPGGAAWDDYVAFLRAASKIGLIEAGYAHVSEQRGHTDVRLPWVRKGDPLPTDPKPPAPAFGILPF